ncbi:UNVERIFIED_CONTAM: hypothetical protein Sindi_0715200 [Sesamum indicum]
MRVACPLEPLDLACLVRTGLVMPRSNTYKFIPAGPPSLDASSSRPLPNSDEDNSCSSEEAEDDNSNQDSHPRTSKDRALTDIAHRMARNEDNLMGLFEHIGLTPRHPPTP